MASLLVYAYRPPYWTKMAAVLPSQQPDVEEPNAHQSESAGGGGEPWAECIAHNRRDSVGNAFPLGWCMSVT